MRKLMCITTIDRIVSVVARERILSAMFSNIDRTIHRSPLMNYALHRFFFFSTKL